MTDEQPYWFTLISYWVKDQNNTGLTIPFVIGAQEYFEVNSGPKTVTDLITLVKNSNVDDTIILNNCPGVGEYVLAIEKGPYPMDGKGFKNESNGNIILKATISTRVLGKDFESICKSLEKKYGSHIQKGNYSKSKVDFEWQPFTDEDIKMINKAKIR